MGGAGDDLFDAVRAQRRRRLRHRRPAPPPGARGPGGGPWRPARTSSTPGHWSTEASGSPPLERDLLAALAEDAATARLGWRPTSAQCAPTRGTSRSVPNRREVCRESRARAPAASARPPGRRHPAGPDRPRTGAPPADRGIRRPRGQGRACSATSSSGPGPRSATSSARSPRPRPTSSSSGTGPARDRVPARRRGRGPPRTSRRSSTSSSSLARRQGELEEVGARGHGARRGARARRRRARAGDGRPRRPDRGWRPPSATRALAALDAEAAQVGAPAPRPRRARSARTCVALYEKIRATQRWHRRGRAAPAPLRRLPARAQPGRPRPHPGRPPRTRCSAARSAAASSCGPPSPASDALRRRTAVRRGRRERRDGWDDG